MPSVKDISKPLSTARSQAPVFVMGCHRSGTNLLYDTLLSAGGFAIYRGYLPVHKMLIPRFGKLDKRENREKLIEVWLGSQAFHRSGLEKDFVRDRVLNECKNGGDFIRITMDEITRRQGATRWAVYDPDAVVHLPRIKADLPEAIFLHIVRDGRDIALSLRKMGGFRPLPWNRKQLGLLQTALYWEWMVSQGRRHGSKIRADYIEIHYEDLVSEPNEVLRRLGEFIAHDLDYHRIQQTGLGRIRESNSSFRKEPEVMYGTPVNRWKAQLMPEEIAELEATIGDSLEEFGYQLTTAAPQRRSSFPKKWMRFFYRSLLETKLFLKVKTPLRRLASISPLEIDASE